MYHLNTWVANYLFPLNILNDESVLFIVAFILFALDFKIMLQHTFKEDDLQYAWC